MSSYWLDSDVLVFAKDTIAPLGFKQYAGFWTMVQNNINSGVIKITRRNYKEITEGRDTKDDLAQWLSRQKREHVCVVPPKEVQAFVTKIADYVYRNDQFLDRYRIVFSNGADPWLIAQAAADHGTVVTREVCEPLARKPKIPDICKHFDVKWISLIDMMKTLGS